MAIGTNFRIKNFVVVINSAFTNSTQDGRFNLSFLKYLAFKDFEEVVRVDTKIKDFRIDLIMHN